MAFWLIKLKLLDHMPSAKLKAPKIPMFASYMRSAFLRETQQYWNLADMKSLIGWYRLEAPLNAE